MGYLIIELLPGEAVATRFRLSGRTLVCEASRRQAAGEEGGVAALLASCGRREDDTVILALDPALFSCRETALPLTDRRKLREVLPLELKGETACDTDELIFDSIVRSDGTQLALWGEKREIAARIGLLAAAGADPEGVTAALFTWHHLLPDTAGGTYLVADSSGAAVYRDRTPLFFRSFWGGDPAGEIDRTVAALELAGGEPVARVHLLGDLSGMAVPAGREGLWATLPPTAELADAFGGDGAAAAAGAGAWAVARALRKGDLVTFRHGELASTAGTAKVRKKLVVPAILAAVALLIFSIDLGMRYWFVRNDLASLDRSIGAIYREIFPTRKKAVDEVGEVKSEIRRLSGLGSGIGALAALKRLAEIKGNDIAGFYETEIDGNQVRLKGDAATVQAVTDLKNRAATVLSRVEVGEIKTKADGSSTFSLRGTLKEEAR